MRRKTEYLLIRVVLALSKADIEEIIRSLLQHTIYCREYVISLTNIYQFYADINYTSKMQLTSQERTTTCLYIKIAMEMIQAKRESMMRCGLVWFTQILYYPQKRQTRVNMAG